MADPKHEAGYRLGIVNPMTLVGNEIKTILRERSFPASRVLLLDSTETGPVNCGTEHEMSMRQLAETIVALTGSSSPIVLTRRGADDPEKRRPDLTLARTRLGFEPQVGPEEGLRRTIGYFAGRI